MAGRPPNEKTFANMLRIAIKEAHDEDENGNRRDKLRAVADALVSKAMTGDVPAIREMADRLDGKALQTIEANITGSHEEMLDQLDRESEPARTTH